MMESRPNEKNRLDIRAGEGGVGRLAGSHWAERLRATVEKARIDLRRGRLDDVIKALKTYAGDSKKNYERYGDLYGLALALYGRAIVERDNDPAGLRILERAITVAAAPSDDSARDDPEDIADFAAALRLLGRPADAEALIESAVDGATAVPWRVRLEHGRALRLLGRPAEAVAELDAASYDKPGEPFLLLERARCNEDLGQPSATVSDATEAAVGFISRDRLPEAEEASEHALRVAPDDPNVLSLRAEVLLRLGRAAEALEIAENARSAAGGGWAQAVIVQATYRLGLDDEALDAARELLAERPDDVATVEIAAELLVRRGQMEDALELTQRAIDADPGSADLLRLGGLVFAEMRRFDEAERLLRLALETNPEAVDTAASLGRLLLMTDRPAEAIPLLKRATAGDDVRVDWLYQLGECLRLTDEPEAALEFLDRAVAADPSHVLAVGTRGQALLTLGRVEEALTELERAIELDPNLPWVQWSMADALATAGRVDDAVAAVAAYVDVSPDRIEADIQAGAALVNLGRAPDALPYLREAAEDPARADRVLPTLLIALHATGEFDEVIRLGRDRTDLTGTAATVVAEAFRLTGDFTAAVEAADRILAQDPDLTEPLAVRGDSLRRLGDLEGAERDLRASVAGDPEATFALRALGRTLRQLGQYAESEPLLREAVADESQAGEYDAEYADVLRALGRPEEALPYAERGVQHFPDLAFELGIHGSVLRALDRNAEALQAIERSLAIDGTSVWIRAERVLSLVQLQRSAEAAGLARELADDAPDDSYALAVYGLALNADDRPSEGLAVLERSLELSPEPWVQATRGSALIDLGRREEAIEVLNALVESGDGEDPWTRLRLAAAYVLKDPPEPLPAVAVLADLSGESPDLIYALIVRADAYGLLDRKDEARRDFEQALERAHAIGSRDVLVLHATAWSMLKLGQVSDAVRTLLRALDVVREPVMQFDLGLFMLHSERPKRAYTEYQRALELAEKLPDRARRQCILTDALHDLERAIRDRALKPSPAVDEVHGILVAATEDG